MFGCTSCSNCWFQSLKFFSFRYSNVILHDEILSKWMTLRFKRLIFKSMRHWNFYGNVQRINYAKVHMKWTSVSSRLTWNSVRHFMLFFAFRNFISITWNRHWMFSLTCFVLFCIFFIFNSVRLRAFIQIEIMLDLTKKMFVAFSIFFNFQQSVECHRVATIIKFVFWISCER